MAKKKPRNADIPKSGLYAYLIIAVARKDDLHLAVVTGTFLDEIFDRIIRSKLVAGNTTDALLSPDGPLGSSMAKARLVYCLGLIDSSAVELAGQIFQIRNLFAHRLDIGKFSDPDIAAICKLLKFTPTASFPPAPTTSVETHQFMQAALHLMGIVGPILGPIVD